MVCQYTASRASADNDEIESVGYIHRRIIYSSFSVIHSAILSYGNTDSSPEILGWRLGTYSLASSLGHRGYVPVSVDRCHAIIDSFMGTVQAKTLLFFVSKWPTITSTFQCVVSLLKGGNREK